MACPSAPTHPHISAGCVGPVQSCESCITEATITHCHCQTPTNNDKGSVNCGGGGGGGGSGCGKPSPCKPCKKCCGGCGKKCKSCGKKKSCSKEEKVIVTFTDVQGNLISASKVKMPASSEPFTNPQKIDKGGTPILPWNSPDELQQNSPYYYDKFRMMINPSGNGMTHYQWNESPENVQKNMVTVCQLRELQEDQTTDVPYINNMTKSAIENLNNNVNVADEQIDQFHEDCVEAFNEFINDCNDNMDATTDTMTVDNIVQPKTLNWDGDYKKDSLKIGGILDILLSIEDREKVCSDIKFFENIKKSLLNIKSTFSHVTRMLFNMDLEDVRSDIARCIYELYMKKSQGENLLDSIKEYRMDIRSKLIDLHLDNVDALVEYKESFDRYIDNLVTLFPQNPTEMDQIKQKKFIFDSYVDELTRENPEEKYPILG